MLKNFWYPIEFSEDVTNTPKLLRVLGQDLVAYRGEDGKAAVLSNLCIHRGGDLSSGWVDGNCIRCPYHGWKFDASGRCLEIPANTQTAIPKRARVDAYPVEEVGGWIWVFLGDLPVAERPPIPDIPTTEGDGWEKVGVVKGEFIWNAHYSRVMENGIDIAHTPFVHGSSFGNRERPQIEPYDVRSDETSGEATAILMPPLPKGLWKWMRRERTPVRATTGFYMPSVTRLAVDFGMGKMVLIDANVPVDEHTTRTMFVAYRNFFTGRWANRDAKRRVLKIFREDQATVEAQRPELLPYDLDAEMHVKSDSLGVTYRRTRRRFLDRGWGIDTDTLRRDYHGRRVAVIPCPSRREVGAPMKHWVMPEVPTSEQKDIKVVDHV